MEERTRRRHRHGEEVMGVDTASTKIEYLMGILEDEVELYASEFRKTERPKIDAILNYYGFTRDADYETRLEVNQWGNRELRIRWWFDKNFHDASWYDGADDYNIYTTTSITY